MNHFQRIGPILALSAIVSGGRQEFRQDFATHGVVVYDQNICAKVVRHRFFGFG
jgi:hypothetical protein